MSDEFEVPKLDYGGAQKLKKKIRLARFVRLADETENAVDAATENSEASVAEKVDVVVQETEVATDVDSKTEEGADETSKAEEATDSDSKAEDVADADLKAEDVADADLKTEETDGLVSKDTENVEIVSENEKANDTEPETNQQQENDTEKSNKEEPASDSETNDVRKSKNDKRDTEERKLSDIDNYDNSDPDIVIENLDDDDLEFKPQVVRLSGNRRDKSKNNAAVSERRKNDKHSVDKHSAKSANGVKVVNTTKNKNGSKQSQTNQRQESKKTDKVKHFKNSRIDYDDFDGKRFDNKKADGVSILLKILLAILIVAFVAYIASVIYFMSHFSWAISAEGEEQLYNMTAEDVKAVLQNHVQDYFVAVEARDLDTIYLSGHDIDMTCSFDGDIKDAIRTQNPWLWFTYKNNPSRIDLPVQISFDEELLADFLEDAIFSKSGREPANAKFVDNPDQYAFILQPEDNGTVIDKTKATAAISATIKSLGDSVDLDEVGAYTNAEVTTDDLEKNGFYKDLINLCETVVNVDWHGIPVVIDKEFIYPLIQNDGQKAWIDYEPVYDYVKELSRKYDLFGQPHKFIDTEGHEINVVMGSYGWRVDRDATAQELYDLICKGGTSSYEPVYRYEAYARGESDIGDSYAEINLTRQHMYLYVDGKVVVESDFVSGNPMKGNGTHVGIYGITYKEKDATLKGQGYSSPVSYWMPFNGNEGMHDASWRSAFGGRIYKGGGSHGCINLPVEIAGQIFEYVDKGFPVIVFTDPEDPAYQESDDKANEPAPEKQEEKNDKPAENNAPLYDANSGLYYIVDPATNAPIFLDPETMQPTDVATAVSKLKAMQAQE